MKKNILVLSLILLSIVMNAQPLWLRYNVISPKGDNIAFTYKGNIYVVDVNGGTARQLTTTESYEYNPVWSNDGKYIAFASDRNGNFDVYIMPAEGGAAKRITTNSSPERPMSFSDDNKYIYYTAYLQKNAENAQFPARWMTELYKVPVDGGRPMQITDATICSMDFDKDGKSFIYDNRKGSEDIWRKHQTSSVARDIVYYNAKTLTHNILTTNVGEDRNPLFVPNSQDIVFLSERNNESFNVYRANIADIERAEKITNFKTHPVRFLSIADNGTLCYGYHGEIYTQTPDGKQKKVNIEIINDQEEKIEYGKFGNPSQITVSQDGKLIAFVSRGEIFVTSDEYSTTKQITHTPEAEGHPCFSPDGRTLVYTSERDGYYNIYTATIERDDEVNFTYSTIINEKPLFEKKDGVERTAPQYSPDGKEIAFIENREFLKVLNLDTKKVRQITNGTQHYGTNAYSFDYSWSPDGKWFALDFISNMRDPYSDIGIVSADGDMIIHNITNDGYITHSPSWALDGNAIIFASNRYGMRSHASWGSQNDAFIAFLNQDAYDKFRLSKEDYELLKEEEKMMKSKSKKEEKKENKEEKKDEDKKERDKKDVKPIVVELDGLDERIIRLTPMSSQLSGLVLSKDGEKLFFLSAFEKGYDLWELDVREKSTKVLAKLNGRGASLVLDEKGNNIYVLSGSDIKKIDAKNGKSTPIKYNASMELDKALEREYMFNHVFLQQSKRFFMTNDNGVDFPALKEEYKPFLAHINNNYDFSELLSEILGELNVSHSGSGYRAPSNGDVTAELGLLLDLNYTGDGLLVSEIIEKGPFDVKASEMKVGNIIEKIDGVEITKGMDYYPLLNKKADKITLVTFYNPSTKERHEEIIKPISKGKQTELLYQRWIKNNAAMVDSLSGGRLGYVHIKSMGDASYRDVYADILGKYNRKEGIVIDTRFNGGGRLHEDIEILFSGEKYLEQVIRDTVACVMPSRRYVKPSIMVMGEANYSNAHGTPWVYKHKKIGQLVGMPVPGTMSSVSWETLQDPSLYFGLPIVGYRTQDGVYLENSQLEPDIKVRNTPEKLAKGIDEQLEAAVEALLKTIDSSNYWGE